jgi:hypothetical protein
MRLFSIPSAGRLGATGAHKDARVGTWRCSRSLKMCPRRHFGTSAWPSLALVTCLARRDRILRACMRVRAARRPPFLLACARAACVMSLGSRWEHHLSTVGPPPRCWCAAAAAATASSSNSNRCYAIGPLSRLPSCSPLALFLHARAGAVLGSAVVNKEACIVIQSLSGLSFPRVCVSSRTGAFVLY